MKRICFSTVFFLRKRRDDFESQLLLSMPSITSQKSDKVLMKASLLMNFYNVPGYFLIDSIHRKILKFSAVKANRNDQSIIGTKKEKKKTIKNFKWNSSYLCGVCLCVYESSFHHG